VSDAAWCAYEDIPPRLIEAIISIEDHRFYEHSGIDVVRTAKAAWDGLLEWRNAKGHLNVDPAIGAGILPQPGTDLFAKTEGVFHCA
jgi:hypothetical protein